MRLITNPADLGPFAGCAFVPTMGALHAGHARLVEHAVSRQEAARAGVVVSVFVNPTQFNDPRDLERYPRTLESDLVLCEKAGAAAVFAPSVEAIYPGGAQVAGTGITPGFSSGLPPTSSHAAPARLPEVATSPELEDAHRPGHFAGVCQVVKRLFELVRPAAATFGEKDWQQLQVIRAMTAEQRLGVEIVPVPTMREPDGLAMSSRNVFLTHQDRVKAKSLSAALCAACGDLTASAAEATMARVLRDAGAATEYAVVRDPATLMPLAPGANAGRALIAARVGSVRLIDNAEWRAAG